MTGLTVKESEGRRNGVNLMRAFKRTRSFGRDGDKCESDRQVWCSILTMRTKIRSKITARYKCMSTILRNSNLNGIHS